MGLFFGALLVTGLSVAGDYGISWDEFLNREHGAVAYNYVTSGDRAIFSYEDRHYGTAFELPLYALERWLGLTDSRAIFIMRHRATFLVFAAGVAFFYLLCRRRFDSWGLALTGCALLVLSPRIIGQAFYNSKDLPFLAACIAAMYTLVVFLDARTVRHAIVHGFACAVLIDIRVTGILLPAVTLLCAAYDHAWVNRNEAGRNTRLLVSLAAYALSLAAFTVLCWPLLWQHPLQGLIDATRDMSRFAWLPGQVLYLGREVNAAALPWHYVPVWIAVSTPLVHLVLVALGAAAIVVRTPGGGFDRARQLRFDLLVIVWLAVPVATVIALRSVLYDAWRQLYFVYPALVLVAVSGVAGVRGALSRAPGRVALLRRLFAAGLAAALVPVALFVVENHPHQDVYFNRLAGPDMAAIKQRFELDYWGLSYREVLECVLVSDARPRIAVLAANDPGRYNAAMLPASERQRITFVADQRQADYFISNYRWHRDEYPIPASREVCAVMVGNARINVAYRLR